jgi:hypothetical protein
MAAFIATKKVLQPVSSRLKLLSIDPQSYAHHGKTVEWSVRPQGILADWKKLETLEICRSRASVLTRQRL